MNIRPGKIKFLDTSDGTVFWWLRRGLSPVSGSKKVVAKSGLPWLILARPDGDSTMEFRRYGIPEARTIIVGDVRVPPFAMYFEMKRPFRVLNCPTRLMAERCGSGKETSFYVTSRDNLFER